MSIRKTALPLINPGKPPALPGRHAEFDISGSMLFLMRRALPTSGGEVSLRPSPTRK